jgi:hypothetical protein
LWKLDRYFLRNIHYWHHLYSLGECVDRDK